MVRRIAPGQWHLRCSTPNTQIIVLAIENVMQKPWMGASNQTSKKRLLSFYKWM